MIVKFLFQSLLISICTKFQCINEYVKMLQKGGKGGIDYYYCPCKIYPVLNSTRFTQNTVVKSIVVEFVQCPVLFGEVWVCAAREWHPGPPHRGQVGSIPPESYHGISGQE